MDQTEKDALRTFCLVPEIYQQAFIQAGENFPDELVSQIKQAPNQAIELLNSDKALKNEVVTIFKNNQEAIMDAVNKQTGMFKSGGKLEQGLQKFQNGGGFSKAVGYYRRHANEGIIRKIQNFLYARGYYTGELDGKFGNQTYDAVPNMFLFQQGGSITIDPKAVKQANKKMQNLPDYKNVWNRRVGYAVDQNGNKYIAEDAIVGDNTAFTTVVASPTDTLVQQRIPTMKATINRTYKRGSDGYESVMERIRPLFKIFGQ